MAAASVTAFVVSIVTFGLGVYKPLSPLLECGLLVFWLAGWISTLTQAIEAGDDPNWYTFALVTARFI